MHFNLVGNVLLFSDNIFNFHILRNIFDIEIILEYFTF